MIDPLFWLGLSILLVAVSLTAVLVAALPALQELARAARSAEKLFDTLRRDLPPTLEAIRLTGLEISDLTDDVSDGVKSAVQVAQQVDQSLDNAVKQAQKVEVGTRSVVAGVKAAWKTLTRTPSNRSRSDRLLSEQRRLIQLRREASSSLAPGGVTRSEITPSQDNRSTLDSRTYTTNSEDSHRRDASDWQSDLEPLDFEDSLPNSRQTDD